MLGQNYTVIVNIVNVDEILHVQRGDIGNFDACSLEYARESLRTQ